MLCLDSCCVYTKNQVRLMNKFRSLWEQHDVWTRETINSIVFELPNQEFVIARLLRNPVDMARVFGEFYGQRVACRIEQLFTAHLTIAAELVTAARDGDTQAVEDARRRWYQNARDIARFLDRINPFWTFEEWIRLMNHHLMLVEQEAVLLITGKYEENVAIYDEIEKQSLVMADLMSSGIIRQFRIS